MSTTGKSQVARGPRTEKPAFDLAAFDLATEQGRQRAAEAALQALATGALSSAGATGAASLLRVMNDNKVKELQTKVLELSSYAADLEARLEQLSPRGRH